MSTKLRINFDIPILFVGIYFNMCTFKSHWYSVRELRILLQELVHQHIKIVAQVTGVVNRHKYLMCRHLHSQHVQRLMIDDREMDVAKGEGKFATASCKIAYFLFERSLVHYLFSICGLQKYNCFLECPIISVLLYNSYEAARGHRADYVSEW